MPSADPALELGLSDRSGVCCSWQAVGAASAGGAHGAAPSNTSRFFSADIGLVHFIAL